jgi:competence protein ComEC
MAAELERRPLVLACLSLILGLVTLPAPLAGLVGLAGLLWFVKNLKLRGAAVAFFLLGLIVSPPPTQLLVESTFFAGEATVATVPRVARGGFQCEIEAQGRLYRLYFSEPSLSMGDRIRVSGVVNPPKEASDEFFSRKGISGTLSPRQGSLEVVSGGSYLFRQGLEWRRMFVGFTDHWLEPRAAQVLQAVCFNIDGALTPELRENLQRTGTMHIVSASGMHVMIFALFLQALLLVVPVPRHVQLGLLILVLILYAAATGLRPPVVRAVMMAAIVLGAYMVRREYDVLSALAGAGLLYLIWRPAGVWDPGFQLSFAAVVSLSLFWRPMGEPPPQPVPRLLRSLKLVARTSAIATLATGPLVAYHFGLFSISSIVANVLIVPVLPFMMMGAMVSLVLFPIIPPLSVGIMKLLVGPLAGYLLLVVEQLGSLQVSAMEVPQFSAYLLILFYGALILAWRPHVRQP